MNNIRITPLKTLINIYSIFRKVQFSRTNTMIIQSYSGSEILPNDSIVNIRISERSYKRQISYTNF